MPRLRAVLWDVDGTLAETERDGHRVAFNLAFEACGLPWRWDDARYGELLAITGGRERLLHDMRHRVDAPEAAEDREALAGRLHELKNRRYAERVSAGCIPLRPGVVGLLDEITQRGVAQAIVTTTSRMNVDALLRVHLGPHWAERFAAIVCGEDVPRKKPDPSAHRRALQSLSIGGAEAIALEDSPAGAAAAQAAGCPVVVTRSVYFDRVAVPGAVAIGPGLHTRTGWQPALPSPGAAAAHCVGWEDLERWWLAATRVAP